MKESSVMPKEGQFVAVWTYKGELWSDTFLIDERGNLTKYEHFNEEGEFDDFGEVLYKFPSPEMTNIKYFT